jgi:hypothetical protein
MTYERLPEGMVRATARLTIERHALAATSLVQEVTSAHESSKYRTQSKIPHKLHIMHA